MKKLLEDKRFIDIEFNVGEISISAHKCIIAAHSWYFANLFLSSQFTNPYVVENAEPIMFKKVVEWMYTNELCLQQNEYVEFCHIINFYGIDSLRPLAITLFDEHVKDLEHVKELVLYDYLHDKCVDLFSTNRYVFRDQSRFYEILSKCSELNEKFIKILIEPIRPDYIKLTKEVLQKKADECLTPLETHIIYDRIDELTKSRPDKDTCIQILKSLWIDSSFLNDI